MTYLVTKQTARAGAVRWRLEHDGCVLGHYPTRKAALLTGRILAGRKGIVICKPTASASPST